MSDPNITKGRQLASLVRALIPFLPPESQREAARAKLLIQSAIKSHPIYGPLALCLIAIEMEEEAAELKAAGDANAKGAMETALDALAKSAQAGFRGSR